MILTGGRVEDLCGRPNGVVGLHGAVHDLGQRVKVAIVWREASVGVAPRVQDVLPVAVERQEKLEWKQGRDVRYSCFTI